MVIGPDGMGVVVAVGVFAAVVGDGVLVATAVCVPVGVRDGVTVIVGVWVGVLVGGTVYWITSFGRCEAFDASEVL